MNTLNESMAQTCCKYEDVKSLIIALNMFNSEKPHMVWEQIRLRELIGGYTDE